MHPHSATSALEITRPRILTVPLFFASEVTRVPLSPTARRSMPLFVLKYKSSIILAATEITNAFTSFLSKKIASQWNNPGFQCFWITNVRNSFLFTSVSIPEKIPNILSIMPDVNIVLKSRGTARFDPAI